MTATAQPKAVRNERRIIERPRLIKLLDDTDARIILLLAPAGYGKTTLARQWAKTLNGAIWLTLTSSHRDISVLATDLAGCVDGVAEGAVDFVSSYIRARANPQNAAREVARTVAGEIHRARVQWIVIDDYHEVVESPEVGVFFDVLHHEVNARFLVASRARPGWTSARLAVYGDLETIERDALAMDTAESKTILGDAQIALR